MSGGITLAPGRPGTRPGPGRGPSTVRPGGGFVRRLLAWLWSLLRGSTVRGHGRNGMSGWVLGGVVLALLLALVGGTAAKVAAPAAPTGPALSCSSTVGGLTAEQKKNAATIVAVGQEMGVPKRGQVVALATAMQESRLVNVNYGDRDSLGLFQQRPSQGWGTPSQVRDPKYAARKFYDGLLAVPGWERKRVTVAAQTVQRSAFPDAYAKWEPTAAAVATGTSCREA